MLEKQINGFIAYCKVAGFKNKSIESLSLRINQFNCFINQSNIHDIASIQYYHLRQFVADYKQPSIHVKKARILSLRQFYHYLILKGQVEKNIATDLAYPKIEKTVPYFLTAAEYEHILEHCASVADGELGLRNLIIVLLLGTLGLRTNAVIVLNTKDVDLTAGLLWVREKGGIARTMLMPTVLCTLMGAYLPIGKRCAAHFFYPSAKNACRPGRCNPCLPPLPMPWVSTSTFTPICSDTLPPPS